MVRLTGKTYALTKISNELRDAVLALYDKNEKRALDILKSLRRDLAEFLRDGLLDDETLLERLDKEIELMEREDPDFKGLEELLSDVQRRLMRELEEENY